MENGKTLGHSSVGLLVLAVIFTCGIYSFVWFFERRKQLEQLQTPTRLAKQWLVLLPVLAAVSIAAGIIGGESGDSPFRGLGSLLNLVETALFIFISFVIRRILNEYYNQHLQLGVPISAVLTFFFTIFYLQYKMNRLPAPIETLTTLNAPIDPAAP